MAEFSADRAPSLMPVRLSQRTSKGAEVAQKAMKPGRSQGGAAKLGRVAPGRQGGGDQQVGRPAPEQDASQPQDLSYLNLALQHFNMKGLGRDVPYLVWANLTGNYRQYAQPGRPPFDYLEDA